MHGEAGEGPVMRVEADERPVLLVENVHHHQTAVSAAGEDDRRSDWTPGGRGDPHGP